MPIPPDYAERVYAGVLGKLIGVYLGRPIEGWPYQHIVRELGEIRHYVHERLGVPLVVTDDDVSGTFTFPRALADHGDPAALTAAEIGQTWLNYIIEERTHLWWGGMGQSTEHTAYLRLKHGVPAPTSGSADLNGRIVAEQIGAQIFIDGWAMVAPGDPERAADLARRAASVSHDGAAVQAAQVVAAMESLAFCDPDIEHWLDAAVGLLPPDSLVARVIADIRHWHAGDGDWRRTRARIEERYGYDTYGGVCHVIPNHALIHLAVLYGAGDFGRSLMIVNTAGWDTDCNSGNVGCLVGIRNGLAGLEGGPDWRGPVADRLFLPGADGGRAITDAVRETYHLVNTGRRLAGLAPVTPKGGARFHFNLPGAVQGFRATAADPSGNPLVLENVAGGGGQGRRVLALHYRDLQASGDVRASTATFIPPDALRMGGYPLVASPTLYSGQVVRATVAADPGNPGAARCRLTLAHYGADDRLVAMAGPTATLAPGERHDFIWPVPDTNGAPIAQVGLEILADSSGPGTLYLDALTWDGAPRVTLDRPTAGGNLWRRAWVSAVDRWEEGGADFPHRLIQNAGRGMVIQGTREWNDLRVEATVRVHLAASAGLATRVQGLRRYYALLLTDRRRLRLVRMQDEQTVLAERELQWEFERPYRLGLAACGRRLSASVDGETMFDLVDSATPLDSGAIALVCEEGHMEVGPVTIRGGAGG